jgi:prefoldin subunit 4
LSAQPGGDTSPDVEVTWQDQDTLNTFARLNNKAKVIEAELKEKREQLEQVKDAEGDVMMLTEGPVRFQIGETYFHLSDSDASSMLEKSSEKIEQEIEQLETQASELKGKLSDLKAHLYAKFGRNINLED